LLPHLGNAPERVGTGFAQKIVVCQLSSNNAIIHSNYAAKKLQGAIIDLEVRRTEPV
jgi:hypothetical protein